MFAVRAEKGVTPGRWSLIEYKGELGILAGDLPDLDWRRSTAIVKVEVEPNDNLNKKYLVTTRSGSQYLLYAYAYGLTRWTASIANQLAENTEVKIVWTSEEAYDRLEQIANGTV